MDRMTELYHRHAESVAEALVKDAPQLDAVWLFGSVAREEADVTSDIDLLLVSSRPMRGRAIRTLIPNDSVARFSFVCHTWESLESQRKRDWSFFVHLHEDGKALYDPGDRLSDLLGSTTVPTEPHLINELLEEDAFLQRFEDLRRFDNNYLFPLARLFSVAKYVCMLDNTASGVIEFDRQRAFDVFRRRHPRAAPHVETVRRLWPFLARTQGRAIELPFSPTCRDTVVMDTLTATRHLLESAGVDRP